MDYIKRAERVAAGGYAPSLSAHIFLGLISLWLLASLGFHRADLEKIIGMGAAGEVDVSGSVSETVRLADINDALRRLAERKGDPVRVTVRPTE